MFLNKPHFIFLLVLPFFFITTYIMPETTTKAMQKRKTAQAIATAQANAEAAAFGNLIAQFKSTDGETTGPPLNLPADTTPEQLQLLINELLGNVCEF